MTIQTETASSASYFHEQTPEQAHWLEVAREYIERVVSPRARELDAQPDPRDSWSWELVEQADAVGLRTLTLAKEYGGAAIDTLTATMVIEELCRGELGMGVVIAQNLKILQMLQAGATEAQRRKYLTIMAEDPRALLAVGATEPRRGGSDNFIPHEGPDSFFDTNAVKVEGGWVINGMKHFISNGPRARVYMVMAQTTPNIPGTQGGTLFLFEPDAPGFSIGKYHNKLGERLVNNAQLIFENVFVPDEDVFGKPNGAYAMLGGLIPSSNVFAGASALGTAQACYDRALEWSKHRIVSGKVMIEHDSVAAELADMRMQIDVTRAYLHRAAWLCDHREAGWDPTMTCYPKVAAAKVCWDVASRAMELHGGYGFMREDGNDMEKLLRDASTWLHSDGTNAALLIRAGRLIRGANYHALPV